MESIIDLLTSPIHFWMMLIASNLLMFISTIFVSRVHALLFKHKQIPLTRQDAISALTTLAINIAIAAPGYLLFLNGHITFSDENFVGSFILLFFLVDILMYLLHFASHKVWPFKKLHEKHHEHHDFNEVSLYVMHPMEALLFGLLLTIIPVFIELNLLSFILFLFVNWLMGTIAHLNTQSTRKNTLFGNNQFHKRHHESPGQNLGFFTTIWDRLFGTYQTKR